MKNVFDRQGFYAVLEEQVIKCNTTPDAIIYQRINTPPLKKALDRQGLYVVLEEQVIKCDTN
jgi:predicted site-specific integrase-resolvase